jgi:GT2 family glycosyltransferase
MESTENNRPFVSIVILSFNRRNDLDYTLQRVFEQDYTRYEVIVVDNHSEDGSAEMVQEKYPFVTLIQMPENIGIVGWNEGAKAAKGEYLLLLDDDSYPAPETLSRTIPQCSPTIITALDIRTPDGEYYAPYFQKQPLYPTFIGCGVIIPRTLFIGLQGFEQLLFLYAHEVEFTMRALQAGYKIQYTPNAIVYHVCSRKNRLLREKGTIDKRRQYYQNRNIIILFLLHFPPSKVGFRIFRFCAGRLLFSLSYHSFTPTFRGLCNGMIVALRNRDKRLILDIEIQRLYSYGKYLGSFFADGNYGFKRPRWL